MSEASRIIIYNQESQFPRLNICSNCKYDFKLGEKIFSRGNKKRKRYCLKCAKRFKML